MKPCTLAQLPVASLQLGNSETKLQLKQIVDSSCNHDWRLF
jgi:hypothetical protein